MTFMPDAHRPKAAGEAGCWAGGNFACDAPATEPLGLCDRHRAEITSDESRTSPMMVEDELCDPADECVWCFYPDDEEDAGERVFGWPDPLVDITGWTVVDPSNADEFTDMTDSWPTEPWEDT